LIKKNKIYKWNKPECINDGCGSPVHTRKTNKNGTYDVRTECYRCHMGGRNRPGVTPHKKKYCENIDERLGFKCVADITDSCMLEMDHIDGERWNNVPENVQTLCRNCHAYKTKYNGDMKNNRAVLYTDLNTKEYETALTRLLGI
tara:strand:- start:289 stop:723 length:435 start_codon:yes stop_codon:yes gene_type:complete